MKNIVDHGEFWRIKIINPPPNIAEKIARIANTKGRFSIQDSELRECVLKKLVEKFPGLYFPQSQILIIFLFQQKTAIANQFIFEIILPYSRFEDKN